MFKMYSDRKNISQEVTEAREDAFLCVQLFKVEEIRTTKCFVSAFMIHNNNNKSHIWTNMQQTQNRYKRYKRKYITFDRIHRQRKKSEDRRADDVL